jgi:hypothetical protein
MLDTISSQRIEPIKLPVLGSSSTDGEGKDFFYAENLPMKSFCRSGYPFSFDVASRFSTTQGLLETETFKQKQEVYDTMIEHDIFIKMPPRKKYSVKAKITCIRKAEPRIVAPEMPYTGI